MSTIRSAAVSRPTERRTRPPVMPRRSRSSRDSAACDIVLGYEIRHGHRAGALVPARAGLREHRLNPHRPGSLLFYARTPPPGCTRPGHAERCPRCEKAREPPPEPSRAAVGCSRRPQERGRPPSRVRQHKRARVSFTPHFIADLARACQTRPRRRHARHADRETSGSPTARRSTVRGRRDDTSTDPVVLWAAPAGRARSCA